MIKYFPEDLRVPFETAVSFFNKHSIEGSIGDFDLGEFECSEYIESRNFTISKDSKMDLYFGENGSISNVEDFLKIYQSISDAHIDKERSCAWDSNEAYYLVNFWNYETIPIFQKLIESENPVVIKNEHSIEFWRNSIEIENKVYFVSLFHGFNIFNYLMVIRRI